MRRKILILILLLLSTKLFATDNALEFLKASSDGNVITIEWKSLIEDGIQYYEIERASDNTPFNKITTVQTKGNGSYYKYVDEEALRKVGAKIKADIPLVQTNYSYRLKIIKKDNSFYYSNSVNVTHSVSIIKRTWGMIKEMFK